MSELRIIPNGALLIRNGIVEEAGTARRIENLAAARGAREIDASGRIVMPAFVDPDAALVSPCLPDKEPGAAIRVLSRKNVQSRAALAAADRARYGCLTVGSSTACATDIRNVVKILRVQRALQSRPLRIRSVFSYVAVPVEELIERWLPAIRANKMASVIEFAVESRDPPVEAALAASAAGFAIRMCSEEPLDCPALTLALSGGAIAIISPMGTVNAFTGPLAAIGCVRVIPAARGFKDDAGNSALNIRAALNEGAAVALASGRGAEGFSSFNMQLILHLAVSRLRLTPEEAIVASTYNAACSLRLSHVTGSLEPGKSADLAMFEVPDYRDLARRAGHHDISLMMRAGEIVFRRTPLIPN